MATRETYAFWVRPQFTARQSHLHSLTLSDCKTTVRLQNNSFRLQEKAFRLQEHSAPIRWPHVRHMHFESVHNSQQDNPIYTLWPFQTAEQQFPTTKQQFSITRKKPLDSKNIIWPLIRSWGSMCWEPLFLFPCHGNGNGLRIQDWGFAPWNPMTLAIPGVLNEFYLLFFCSKLL